MGSPFAIRSAICANELGYGAAGSGAGLFAVAAGCVVLPHKFEGATGGDVDDVPFAAVADVLCCILQSLYALKSSEGQLCFLISNAISGPAW
jgi:hypothetical protein